MRKICVKIIKLYQKFSLARPAKCKMCPTCSNYAITAIERFGALKGVALSIKRSFRCAKRSSNIVDPVPQNLKGDYKWLM